MQNVAVDAVHEPIAKQSPDIHKYHDIVWNNRRLADKLPKDRSFWRARYRLKNVCVIRRPFHTPIRESRKKRAGLAEVGLQMDD